jgi:hypothetical protein
MSMVRPYTEDRSPLLLFRIHVHYTRCVLLNEYTDAIRLISPSAITMQIGNVAAAYFTTAIATHTFNSLVLLRPQSVFLCVFVIIFGWLIAVSVGTSSF